MFAFADWLLLCFGCELSIDVSHFSILFRLTSIISVESIENFSVLMKIFPTWSVTFVPELFGF
jgi:hypothetical protein